MKNRSEFFEIYKVFRALVKTQHFVAIKCFKCDLGGEYTSNKFLELLSLDGTMQQTSCISTPAQNGVAKRKHRHIVEIAQSLLSSASIPSEFWGEVVLTAVTLINIIPSSHISGISHFEKLYRYASYYSFFRVFGCTYFFLKPHVECSKLSSRSVISVFLGYRKCQKGYLRCDPTTQELYVSRHVVFLEHIHFFYISSSIHDLIISDLIRIDPFFEDSNNLSSQVIVLQIPLLMFFLIFLCIIHNMLLLIVL